MMNYDLNRLLIDACKKNNVDKFILLSKTFVTRPNTFVAFCLNNTYGDVLKWKLNTEIELRESNLDYNIIRVS